MREMHGTYYVAFDVPGLEPVRREALRVAEEELGVSVEHPSSPAHLTVKHHLELSPREAAALGEQLEVAVRKQKFLPTAATVGALHRFVPSGTVYVPLSGPVVASWKSLIEEFRLMGYPRKGFEGLTPHVTLLTDVQPRERLDAALRAAAALADLPAAGKPLPIRSVVIYKKNRELLWVEAHRIGVA